MQTIPATREGILARARAARDSTEKPDLNIDLELASLHSTLAMRRLTEQDYNTGRTFTGFLLNTGWSMYARADDSPKWLYAAARTTAEATRWIIQKDGLGRCVLKTLVGDSYMYFNWRNTTGACKLYDSSDPMTLVQWDMENKFHIQQSSNGEEVGTWSDSDNEMYIRQKVVRREWAFEIFDESTFSADDRLIYSAYLKEIPAS